MAEAPPHGIFWFALDDAARRAERDGDRIVVDVEPHGPAGASSVDLPGGDVVQVDHLDPTRLVGVESALTDPGGSPLLVALFGGDGALRLSDRDPSTDLHDPEDRDDVDRSRVDGDDPRWADPRRGRPTQLDQDAQRVGRLVVLADLATDPAAEPLARVVAAAEFVDGLDGTAGGDQLAPMVPRLVDHAVVAAEQVDDDTLVALDPKLAHLLIAALRPLVAAAPTGTARSVLFELVQRIDSSARRDGDQLQVAASMAPYPAPEELTDDAFAYDDRWADEAGSPTFADRVHGRASAPSVRVVRRSPSLLEVTAPRSDHPRWVRALRTDGLVAVAQAPLHRDGLMSSAELVVPPDTDTASLDLQLVEVADLHRVAGAPADLVRRAVRVGRAAASAERSRDRHRALQRWQRCADLWRAVGDTRRARQAMDRGTSAGGRIMVARLLVDELDPFGAEATIEGVDDW